MRGALVALLVLALLAVALPAEASSRWVGAERRFVELLNAERTSRGLEPLDVNLQLLRIARDWSETMAADGRLYHRPDLSGRIYGPWRAVGENVGQASHASGDPLSSTVARLHTAFMNSAGHRANVLGDYDLVAAGAVVRNGRLWVTVNFIRGPKSGFPLFRDIGGSAHEPQVGAVWLADVASGCRFAVFCGDAAVTRAQMATFLAGAIGLEPVGGQRFSDVDPGSPHAGYINATADAGITSGCDSGGRRFCPSASVTRDQMATFLARARSIQPVTAVRFADVSTDSPHFGNVNAIADAGITSGCDSGAQLYCPNETVRRDQMATFVARAFRLSGSFWRATPTTVYSTPAPY